MYMCLEVIHIDQKAISHAFMKYIIEENMRW